MVAGETALMWHPSMTLTASAATYCSGRFRVVLVRTVSGLAVLPSAPRESGLCNTVRAAFGMRARSEHLRELADKCAVKATAAQDHWTRASFEAERKQLLILAQQAEKLERQWVAGRPRGMAYSTFGRLGQIRSQRSRAP